MAESVDKMLIDMGKAKTLGADLFEIRLDHLKAFNDNIDLNTLIKESPLPTLFTYRYFTEDFLYDRTCFMVGAFQICCCSSISMLGIWIGSIGWIQVVSQNKRIVKIQQVIKLLQSRNVKVKQR